MPANRSRTERWRECLEQVRDRGGALEIAIDSTDSGAESALIWRVRVVEVSDDRLVVEPPSAFGRTITLEQGARLVAAITIGQNRWMFRTEALEQVAGGDRLRLKPPEHVERCRRRNFYRISAAEMNPAPVECWPLMDPASVVAAEVANEALIQDRIRDAADGVEDLESSFVLPEVGPKFKAKLVNIGGGGAGLLIDRDEASAVDRARLFWLRIDLRPHIPAPLGITARLVHTHIDSSQNVYGGMAFDFAFNPAHRDFVVDQIARYARLAQFGQNLRSRLKKAS